MQAPTIPECEADRLATLYNLRVLDTPPEDRFDLITIYSASLFSVQMSMVSLIDAHRQWFKSVFGFNAREAPRHTSFCAHAILGARLLEVCDATEDPRFADNPCVTGSPRIRFYAGQPLTMKNGHRVGTLCLADPLPKRLSHWEREHLSKLASIVEAELQGEDGGSLPGSTRRNGYRF